MPVGAVALVLSLSDLCPGGSESSGGRATGDVQRDDWQRRRTIAMLASDKGIKMSGGDEDSGAVAEREFGVRRGGVWALGSSTRTETA